jgi:hypothetical protein
MNDQPRFAPVMGGPEHAYHNYYGAGLVGFALRVGDWCLQATKAFSEAETDSGGTDHTRSANRKSWPGRSLPCGILLPACTVLMLCVPATKLSAQEQCAQAPVEVTALSPDERRLACSAANDALRLLGRCGISVRRPLRVEIMSEVRHPFSGAIFGLFDIKQDKVLVTQEVNIPSLVKDTPYAGLPQRDFYRSLIVHEVIHGVMHQNLKRPASSHAAYEYPAYALQIESLTPSVREQFLQSFEQDAIRADTIFNDTVLMFDPFFFAARAYRHFKAGNGCAHLNALLAGEVPFILTMPLR